MPPAKTPPITGHPFPTYPTPLIEDTVEVEFVDSVAGSYNPIPFGTRYDEVEHGAFAKKLPHHVLVADSTTDGGMRRRVWVSNRLDQERYNFGISYENNDPEFPNYTRTYVLEREGYTPLELLTPDPYDPTTMLVAEQVINETDPPELRTVYVKVVRIYSTLPGPLSYSIDYPYGGNPSYPRITTKQKVAHMAFPAELGGKCPILNYQDAILIAQTIVQSEVAAIDEIASIYDRIPKITYGSQPGVNDDYAGQEEFGYAVGYLFGMREYPFVTWKFSMDKDDYRPVPDLSFCPIEGFEKLRLVDQSAEGDNKQTQLLVVTRRYESLPGPVISKIDYDNNDPGYPIVSTSQRIAYNEYRAGSIGVDVAPVPTYNYLVLVEQHMVPSDYAMVREDQRIYESNPNSVITSYDYDSSIDALIETKRLKRIAGPPAALDDLTLEYREKPVDRYRTIQIQSRLLALPPTRVEFKTVNNWPFPTLLTGIEIAVTGLIANRNEVVWFPNTLRPIQNVPAILRTTTTYHTSSPPPEQIFVLPTRNLVYRGISFTISISNVLNDQIVLSVDFTSDTKYGGLSESVTFAATNPSATQYYAIIGQYRKVACDISLWRGKIFVKNVSEVILI